MTEVATIKVQILGREYPVACPSNQEAALEAAALYVDNQMREIQERTGTHGIERLAVMAALNIAHRYLQGDPQDVNEALEALSQRIEATLERLSVGE